MANKYLDKDLFQQKAMVIELFELTIHQYHDMFKSLLEEDDVLAQSVVDGDEAINKMQDAFIETALWKIAKQQMVARDLRFVICLINCVREIERVADYAEHIAKYYVNYKPPNFLVLHLKESVEKVIAMIEALISILSKEDIEEAYSLPKYEAEINELFRKENKILIQMFKDAKTDQEIKLIYTTLQQLKYLERAGDHLINIAEMLIYAKEGKHYDLDKYD